VSERSAKHVAAVAVLVIKDGQVLSLRRALHKDAAPGVWEALSGRVEPGEDPLEAAQREVLEECGLEVRIETRPWTAYAADRAGEPMVVVVYRAAYLSVEVMLSDEHDAYAWRTADAFASSTPLTALSEAVRSALEASPPARHETGIY
jgi:8-oxo-dGTP pyrophosphatase MutT (NUDIX family)